MDGQPTPDEPRTITLYHGTPRFYYGPPDKGYKDLLGTGFLSMTGDPSLAELFAGGMRDARIYSVDIPVDAILDLRIQSEALGKADRWDELATMIQDAAASGRYQAVAIFDITMGTDMPEFRLVQKLPPGDWRVEPSEAHNSKYRETDDIITRFNAGEVVSKEESDKVQRILQADGRHDAQGIRVLREIDADGEASDEQILEMLRLEKRQVRDRAAIAALKAGPRPPSVAPSVALASHQRRARRSTLLTKPKLVMPKAASDRPRPRRPGGFDPPRLPGRRR